MPLIGQSMDAHGNGAGLGGWDPALHVWINVDTCVTAGQEINSQTVCKTAAQVEIMQQHISWCSVVSKSGYYQQGKSKSGCWLQPDFAVELAGMTILVSSAEEEEEEEKGYTLLQPPRAD